MSDSCFAERLEHYLPLTDDEKAALAQLEAHQRSYRRGALVRSENDRAQEMFIIHSGWMFSYVLLPDGSRQILGLHFPGDLVGASCAAFKDATEALVAITDVTVCPFDKNGLRLLYEEHPRLAALLFAVAHAERVALTDRLASLGRTSAKSRVAALLLDSRDRLRVMNSSIKESFALPLTQEEIGDATGLTAVHVNRMMRALVEEGLIARATNHITILDEQRLASVANYINRYAKLDLGWLPDAIPSLRRSGGTRESGEGASSASPL